MPQDLQIRLTAWDAQLMIEALKELETKWQHIHETSSDEDEQADYGNDLAVLMITKDRLIKAATEVFGASIASFDRTPL